MWQSHPDGLTQVVVLRFLSGASRSRAVVPEESPGVALQQGLIICCGGEDERLSHTGVAPRTRKVCDCRPEKETSEFPEQQRCFFSGIWPYVCRVVLLKKTKNTNPDHLWTAGGAGGLC